ncbi:ATP synthase complex assembly protein ATP12 TDEL_0G01970 [Torulaspora delbrueckii]|uniref:ATP12 chaperone protein n=1 Tax=Torulaspora delbrueckii TaxID=4950 RepID=G8ZYT9_TORDE|nr:hypothetical protein TDEL_0G01970 [Torulaspora delbrueckii]CCE93564.1 hypothetical protein TDEL_0G01970 [Torulaspora delbrueckii]
MLRLFTRYNTAARPGLSLRPLATQASPLGVDGSTENNLKTETNRLAKTGEKFWEKVSLKDDGSQFLVQLDSKTVLTPLGNALAVDKRRSLLAMLLKKEWTNLPSLAIKTHALPLTSLVSRCIDLENVNKPDSDPEMRAKIGGDREHIANDLLRYLDTDTLLVFCPQAEFEGALRKAQDERYLPIIASVEKFLGQYSTSPIKLRVLDADVDGLRGNSQTNETRKAAKKFLESLSLWDLAIFEKTVLTTKSFICGVLLLQNKALDKSAEGLTSTMESVAQAATLEIIHQTDRWGEVEDTHDVDKRDVRRNIHAAGIVAYK